MRLRRETRRTRLASREAPCVSLAFGEEMRSAFGARHARRRRFSSLRARLASPKAKRSAEYLGACDLSLKATLACERSASLFSPKAREIRRRTSLEIRCKRSPSAMKAHRRRRRRRSEARQCQVKLEVVYDEIFPSPSAMRPPSAMRCPFID